MYINKPVNNEHWFILCHTMVSCRNGENNRFTSSLHVTSCVVGLLISYFPCKNVLKRFTHNDIHSLFYLIINEWIKLLRLIVWFIVALLQRCIFQQSSDASQTVSCLILLSYQWHAPFNGHLHTWTTCLGLVFQFQMYHCYC